MFRIFTLPENVPAIAPSNDNYPLAFLDANFWEDDLP